MQITDAINVKIKGKKRIEDAFTIEDATRFFLQELTVGQTIENFPKVTVELTSSIKYNGEDTDLAASMDVIEDENHYIVSLLNDVPFLEMIKSLAHECVHLVQYASKKLIVLDNDEYIWDNYSYGKAPYLIPHEEYKELLWEKEAYEKELPLAQKFVTMQLTKTD